MSLNASSNLTQGLSVDLRSLDRLKSAAGTDARGQIREVAKQMESLFMQELMKSMRSTTMNSGMLDNQATEMGTSMLDQQFSTQMTGMPRGLSDAIARQLERQMGVQPGTSATGAVDGTTLRSTTSLSAPRVDTSLPPVTTPAAAPANAAAQAGKRGTAAEAFVSKHQQAAQIAEQATGIPASNILGQAALESGWGKHEIRMKDGSPSHNLFAIKATSDWKGKVAEVTTTEYVNGQPRQVTAKFRAYDSYAEAFTDHARLLSQSPRYASTVAQADSVKQYAQGLQKAGYATDPAYADKLTRTINTTLRLQRSLA